MLATVFTPFLLALLAPALMRAERRAAGWVLAGLTLLSLVPVARHLPLAAGVVHEERLAWLPALGVELSFAVDGLSATFALLVGSIGALVVLYASGYMKGHPRERRFFSYLLLFMGAMQGVVLSDNLVALFVFWELTSVTSYLLIGFDHASESARRSALKALVVTGGGGLALLAGIVLLGIAGASLGLAPAEALSARALASVDITSHALYPAILLLVVLGAVTKSAQVPFHFWLPAAMAAPTPVSAYLHSATMVKAGVFLLALLHPVLGGTTLWQAVVTPFGVVTMLVGAALALGQSDLKKILAYTTLSVLGILTMLLGAGTPLAIKAAVVFLVAHALYKAALFMVAGNLDHETGTRDLHALGGLARLMPFTAAAGIVAALSQAGAPPMFGFVGKELLYKAKLDVDTLSTSFVVAAVVANIALVAAALLAGVRPFYGRRLDTPKMPHEAPFSMIAGPLALATASLFIGIFPGVFDTALGTAMASAIAGEPLAMTLKLWHGVNPEALLVLLLSGLTLALGFALYRVLKPRLAGAVAVAQVAARFWPTRGFEAGLAGLAAGAKSLTSAVQSGYLRRYVIVTALAATALAAVPTWRALGESALDFGPAPHFPDVVVALLTLAGAIFAAVARSRLTAVASLGVTGLGVSIFFALYGAPDLALTQIMVDTLTVILFVLVFHHLPPFANRSRPGTRLRDLAIAVAGGAVVTGLVLAGTTIGGASPLAEYFAQASVSEANGRNVVNVILVDFRALDTLGEITVVAVAAIGAYALLRPKGRHGEDAR